MLIGQTVTGPASPAKATYYTPWFPRQGNSLSAVIQVLKSSGAFAMTVQLQTKNQEQSDASAALLGSSFNVTTVGTSTSSAPVTGALELVRYRLELNGTPACWVHFRSNPPIWQPN